MGRESWLGFRSMRVTAKLINLPKLCLQENVFCLHHFFLQLANWWQTDGGMLGYLLDVGVYYSHFCLCSWLPISHVTKLIARKPKQTRFKTSGSGHDFTVEQEDVTDAWQQGLSCQFSKCQSSFPSLVEKSAGFIARSWKRYMYSDYKKVVLLNKGECNKQIL